GIDVAWLDRRPGVGGLEPEAGGVAPVSTGRRGWGAHCRHSAPTFPLSRAHCLHSAPTGCFQAALCTPGTTLKVSHHEWWLQDVLVAVDPAPAVRIAATTAFGSSMGMP